MKDPFAILGIEPRFDLDLAALERRHRELSKALHPDRFAGAPAAERRLALGRAIEVNEAFRTLHDPVRRAEALARRHGVAVGEAAEPKPAPSLLLEMMESREELAAAARARDGARVQALAGAMRAREAAVSARLGRALDAPEGGSVRGDEVLPLLGELRYLRRFLDEVSAAEEQLES